MEYDWEKADWIFFWLFINLLGFLSDRPDFSRVDNYIIDDGDVGWNNREDEEILDKIWNFHEHSRDYDSKEERRGSRSKIRNWDK